MFIGDFPCIKDSVYIELGFSGTTTKLLAEKIGCSETIIFRIFPTKDAIFEALFTEWKEADIRSEPLTIVGGSALQTLERLYRQMLQTEHFGAGQIARTGWRSPKLGQAAACRNGEEKWGSAYRAVLQESNDVVRTGIAPVITFGQQNGEIRDGDPVLLAELFWCTIAGLTLVRQNYPDRYLEADFSEIAYLLKK